MATKTIRLAKLHEGQARIEHEAKRFNIVCCGRRWGKTKYGIRKLIEPALHGYPVAWFAPTHKMMAEVWRELVRTVQPLILIKNAQDHRIELVTGGLIELWSLENFDSIRGRKYKRAIIDEAAMVAALSEAWQAVIRPTLTDLHGDLFMLSTPKGRNFFWECYQRGLDELRPEWACWQLPTSTNPYIDPAEIAAARSELPEDIFRQEYLAAFLEDEGTVFRQVRARATEQAHAPYESVLVMGVDWAQQHDFTVLSIIDARTGKQVTLDRFNQISWEIQRGRLRSLAEHWKVALIVAELNSIGSPNVEALQAEGLPIIGFETTASSKPPLIESLALAFERGEIGIIDDAVQIAELEAYERTVSPLTGRGRYHAPANLHDDCVMALALAWYGVQHFYELTIHDQIVIHDDRVSISVY